jgi:hypothetical protein
MLQRHGRSRWWTIAHRFVGAGKSKCLGWNPEPRGLPIRQLEDEQFTGEPMKQMRPGPGCQAAANRERAVDAQANDLVYVSLEVSLKSRIWAVGANPIDSGVAKHCHRQG